jgi:hypothetical protein
VGAAGAIAEGEGRGVPKGGMGGATKEGADREGVFV